MHSENALCLFKGVSQEVLRLVVLWKPHSRENKRGKGCTGLQCRPGTISGDRELGACFSRCFGLACEGLWADGTLIMMCHRREWAAWGERILSLTVSPNGRRVCGRPGAGGQAQGVRCRGPGAGGLAQWWGGPSCCAVFPFPLP